MVQYNEIFINDLIVEINEYFRMRDLKPAKANSNSECNSFFKIPDGYLNRILQNMNMHLHRNLIPSFDIRMEVNLSPSKNILTKKCCDCPNDPAPYTLKNTIRAKGDKYLREWALRARAFSGSEEELDFAVDNRPQKVKSFNPFK